jgi:hypothetical protein
MRWAGSAGSIITNPNGSMGLFLSGAWPADGDSDAFNQIFYSESTTGDVWTTPKTVLSTDYTFSASHTQVTQVAHGTNSPLAITAYYEGRAYGPSVVAHTGKLTLVFAGYRTPKGSGTAGTSLGTGYGGAPQWTIGVKTPNLYRNILTVNLAPTTTTSTVTATTTSPRVGQTVTLKATVAALSDSSATPSGTVAFKGTHSGTTTTLCTGTLATTSGAQVASCTYRFASTGTFTVKASYLGNTDGVSSTSPSSRVVTVSKDTTAVTVAAKSSKLEVGQQETLSATVTVTSPGHGTPTGTVSFTGGGGKTCKGTLHVVGSTDEASCTIYYTSPGQHTVRDKYTGDTNDNTSRSHGSATVTITKDTTTTSLTVSSSSPVAGQQVTVSATVSAPTSTGHNTPTGQVTFKGAHGTTVCGASETLHSGVASCTVTKDTVGTYTVTAHYTGDGNDNGSVSSTLQVTVTQDHTTTTLSFTPTSAVSGQTVTLTATVAQAHSGSGDPTGTVTFKTKNGTTICTEPLSDTTPDTANCTTTFSDGSSQTLTATYAGDGEHLGSSETEKITVTKASTATTVSFTPTSVVVGQPVTITATIAVVEPGNGVPTGKVMFKATGSHVLCATVPVSGSGPYTAKCSATPPAHATFTLTAEYLGTTAQLATSQGSSPLVVNEATSTVTVSFTPPAPAVGQKVTVTATVTATAPSTVAPNSGTVSFTETGTQKCTHSVSVTAGHTVATCTVTFTKAGNDAVTVSYSGNSSYVGVSSTGTVDVTKDSTTTGVAPTGSTPKVGQAVTLTATVAVTGPGAGTPTGTVTFTTTPGGTVLCTALTVTPAGGTTGTTVCSTPLLIAGTDHVKATYSGGATDAGSDGTASVTVTKAGSSTALSITTSSPVVGQSVVVKATVSPEYTGAPTGTVHFTLGDGTTCTSALSGSSPYTATCDTRYPSATGFSATAHYLGDANFTGSTGTVTVTVGAGGTTTSVVAAPTSAVVGQTVTFTATVAAASPASGTPTGTVTVSDAGGTLCTGHLNAASPDKASCKAKYSAPVTADSVTAKFDGDSNFTTSHGTATVTVGKAHTSTTITTSGPVTLKVDQTATLSATVTVTSPGSGIPTGTVHFVITGGGTICTGALNGASPDKVTCVTHANNPDTVHIHAVYAGNSSFTGSSGGTLHATIVKGTTTTTVSTAGGVNPSSYGQAVTFKATVAPVSPAGGTPTGKVLFTLSDPAPTKGPGHLPALSCTGGDTQTLVSGVATCAVATDLVISQSPTSVIATYAGSTAYAGSTSSKYTQTIGKDGSTVTVSSKANTTVTSKAADFTATVAAAAPGSGDPTGTVTWTIKGTSGPAITTCTGGNSTVNKKTGAVSCKVGAGKLTAADGPYTVKVTYSGDTDFTTSSGTFTQHVVKATSKVKLTAVAPASSGSDGSVTATVTAKPASAGTPTGTVTFAITGGTPVTCTGGDTVSLSSGSATCNVPTAFVSSGSPYTVTATYNGDGNFLTSTVASPKTVKVK